MHDRNRSSSFVILCALALCHPSVLSRVVWAQEEPTEPAWKSQITLPDEPFQSWTSPPFVKFTIITKPLFDPNIVHFQDSARYEFHYGFARPRKEYQANSTTS